MEKLYFVLFVFFFHWCRSCSCAFYSSKNPPTNWIQEFEIDYERIGGCVNLTCPTDHAVKWRRLNSNYKLLYTTLMHDGKPVVLPIKNTSFLLCNITKEEDGHTYECVIGDLVIKEFLLLINMPYFIDSDYMEYTKIQSRIQFTTIILYCQANGMPPPTITWFKDGKELFKNESVNDKIHYKNCKSCHGDDIYIVESNANDTGNYTCVASNREGSINFTYQVEVFDRFPSNLYIKDKIYANFTSLFDLKNKSMLFNSIPKKIKEEDHIESGWIRLPDNITEITAEKIYNATEEMNSDTIFFDMKGWYAYILKSKGKTPFYQAQLHYINITHQDPEKSNITLILTSIFISIILLFVIVWYILYRRIKNNEKTFWTKKIIVKKSENLNTLPEVTIQRCKTDDGQGREYEFPIDSNWEIPRKNILLGRKLGEGAFGQVLKAKALDVIKQGERNTVAVKMLHKRHHNEHEILALVTEMEIMKTIGNHPNIVNLVGCCTQDGPLFVLTEYAPHGNLLSFLKVHQLEDRTKPNRNNILHEKQLVSFCYQVAQGMEYISSKSYIHRDLAARNVLVSKNYVLKIADFGLSRKCHNYYRKKKDGLLPVKWMAPESLTRLVFTTKSDVWSYGILLYEIMTLGETPYPSIPMGFKELIKLLQNGYRMEKPAKCPQEIYVIMQKCWRYESEERPTFSNLVTYLDKILAKPN